MAEVDIPSIFLRARAVRQVQSTVLSAFICGVFNSATAADTIVVSNEAGKCTLWEFQLPSITIQLNKEDSSLLCIFSQH